MYSVYSGWEERTLNIRVSGIESGLYHILGQIDVVTVSY